MFKMILLILGTLSLCFGIIGIVLPGLPTTPFLILSAGLYLRGSEKFYNVLLNSRILGPYIKKYRNDKGMTLRAKLAAILMMWSMILLSASLLIDKQIIEIVLYIAGFIGTIVMGFIVPTVNTNKKSEY